MRQKICRCSNKKKTHKLKQGRPTKQEVQKIPIRSHNDIMRISDFPELIRILQTLSESANVLVNVKTGPQQDQCRKKIVSKANKKQEKVLASLKKFKKYAYFLRTRNEQILLEGNNIIDLNEYLTIERPYYISSQYQPVYDELNILVRQLDDEFVQEFMFIVNSFIDAFDQRIDKNLFINTLIDNIKFTEEYKILKEWSILKIETNNLQIHYKQQDLNLIRTKLDDKSKNVREKYEQLVIEKEEQISALKQYNCPLEYFINRLISDIESLIDSRTKIFFQSLILLVQCLCFDYLEKLTFQEKNIMDSLYEKTILFVFYQQIGQFIKLNILTMIIKQTLQDKQLINKKPSRLTQLYK
ncbi:hypothetical protein pb186bvf_004526 [Paramecium bursaria]